MALTNDGRQGIFDYYALTPEERAKRDRQMAIDAVMSGNIDGGFSQEAFRGVEDAVREHSFYASNVPAGATPRDPLLGDDDPGKKARQEELRAPRSRASTILTGPRGLMADMVSARRTLLGS